MKRIDLTPHLWDAMQRHLGKALEGRGYFGRDKAIAELCPESMSHVAFAVELDAMLASWCERGIIVRVPTDLALYYCRPPEDGATLPAEAELIEALEGARPRTHAPRVKPLEWIDRGEYEDCDGYMVQQSGDDGWEAIYFDGDSSGEDVADGEHLPTKEAAKEACQRHFERWVHGEFFEHHCIDTPHPAPYAPDPDSPKPEPRDPKPEATNGSDQ